MADFEPAYLSSLQSGLLLRRSRQARRMLAKCTLCPRKCRVNRLDGELGVCKTAWQAMVSSYDAHFGEEAPLVGQRGSGTVFFTHCNLLCLFCQNYDISHEGWGRPVDDKELAAIFLELQQQGCHNINFVTPSHVVPQILAAVKIAAQNGLKIPLVYNSGGYDRVSTLRLLEGVVDIYMPDFKFWGAQISDDACQAADYSEVARRAIKEMHRQVGDLVMDEHDLACRGVLLRHLVLPNGLAGTRDIMRFVAREISPHTYVNIMAQYRPCGRATDLKGLARAVSSQEYRAAVQSARNEGLTRLDQPRRVFMFR